MYLPLGLSSDLSSLLRFLKNNTEKQQKQITESFLNENAWWEWHHNTSTPSLHLVSFCQLRTPQTSLAYSHPLKEHGTHANVWESMRKFCSCAQFTSHARICIRYYKSRACIWTCNEMEGLYDKFIITIVPSNTGRNITRLLPLALFSCYTTRDTFQYSFVLWW